MVLVVNARGAALSVLASVRGFLDFLPDDRICGVILNGCTAMTYAPLARVLEDRLGVKACGFLPNLPDCTLKSRHLGLVTAAEVADLREKMQRLAAEAEQTIDLDALRAKRQRWTLCRRRFRRPAHWCALVLRGTMRSAFTMKTASACSGRSARSSCRFLRSLTAPCPPDSTASISAAGIRSSMPRS